MQKADNRTVGGRFEQELGEVLAANGFWVHVFQQNKSGQPADLIAVRGKFHTLIDCKVISDEKGFPFERIEENQKLAMRMFFNRGNELCYFALRLNDDTVWMVSLERLETLRNRGKKRIADEEIRNGFAWPLEEWVSAAKEWGKDI